MATAGRADAAKARGSGARAGLWCGGRDCPHWLLGYASAGGWNQEQEEALKPGNLPWDTGTATGALTGRPNTCPIYTALDRNDASKAYTTYPGSPTPYAPHVDTRQAPSWLGSETKCYWSGWAPPSRSHRTAKVHLGLWHGPPKNKWGLKGSREVPEY